MAGGDQNADVRPPLGSEIGQVKPISVAGHIDIREKKDDIASMFNERGFSLIDITRFERPEPGVGQHFSGIHPDEWVVIDNKGEGASIIIETVHADPV